MVGVDVVCNVDPMKLAGSKDGYSYKFIQATEDGSLAYVMSNPTGLTKVFTLGSPEIIQEMISSPMAFWMKYIGG